MRAYWEVIFLDYFGLEHKELVYAQSNLSAVQIAIEKFQYPVSRVISCEIQWDYNPFAPIELGSV